jgi:REP element-mobilizing transposase RayT
MPHWLITSTFYGQWLPGDERGSITNVRDRRVYDELSPVRHEHDKPGEPFEAGIPGLQKAALAQLKGPPVSLNPAQAEELLDQFLETATYRDWTPHAVSIMSNHVHLIIEAPTAVGKTPLLRDLKGYGSRRLNRQFGERESGIWWSDGGSARVVRNLASAIHYVCHRQPLPLVVWSRERGRIPVEEPHPANKFGE